MSCFICFFIAPRALIFPYSSLAMPTGFCLLEIRFVAVTLRYGVHPFTVDRWKKILQLKAFFEKKAGCSIYELSSWRKLFSTTPGRSS